MKQVLIHTIPRSGSKTLQSSIQAYLTNTYADTVTLENRQIDYGLDEFFVNRQCNSSYKIYNSAQNTWLLKVNLDGSPIPDGAMWEHLVLNATGQLCWSFIPPKKPFAKNSLTFLRQQYNLLRRLGKRPYVAKMFTGYALYNVKNTEIVDKIYNRFDTHLVLRRRDNLANFLSKATCGRIGNWSAIDQEVDVIDKSQRKIMFSEFDSWLKGMQTFEDQLSRIPNPKLLWLEDFAQGVINIPDSNISLPLPKRETVEYGDKKYQWVANLTEVKSWFINHGYDVK